jgi:hypothetical protein
LLKDGYYNIAGNLGDPGCFELRRGKVWHIARNGECRICSIPLAHFEDTDIYGVSQWLPPGVTFNPAWAGKSYVQLLKEHASSKEGELRIKDENPIKDEIQDEAAHFVNMKAIKIVTAIVNEFTPFCGENVRVVYPRPSMLDRAIAERVLEILTLTK